MMRAQLWTALGEWAKSFNEICTLGRGSTMAANKSTDAFTFLHFWHLSLWSQFLEGECRPGDKIRLFKGLRNGAEQVLIWKFWCQVHPDIARYSRVLQGTKPQSIQRQAKRIKMDEIEWKWIQWMKVDENGWKWMKMEESGWRWMNVDQSGWKWMEVDKMDQNEWK